MSTWIKKGLIFKINKKKKWMRTHSALPFADKISKDVFRIYFSSRDIKNKASIGFVEINIRNPKKIIQLSEEPVLTPGCTGSFDDSGVLNSCVVTKKNKKFLFYTGWNNTDNVPFRWSIGLAISTDGGKNFKKYSEGPILDRNYIDPYFIASPTVIIEKGLWKMWYLSGKKWALNDECKWEAPYQIKYAESEDGINWKRSGIVSIKLLNNEKGIGRTTVLKERGIYKMWYPYSINQYRIGYAESKNGKEWIRMDQKSGITVSKSGWDSNAIEYPCVFVHDKRKYMLYNGNNFGKSGFGIAVMD
tara:strand:+ start:274 stop:1182 length:909 start_codon:yes stop_codon:yes gene_type:complete